VLISHSYLTKNLASLAGFNTICR